MSVRPFALAALVAAALVGPVQADPNALPVVGGAAMFPNKTIVQNAVNSKDHTTLVAAVQAAELVDTLSGPGPFTVFAPTNAAFAALPAGTVDTLLMPENKAMLQKVLGCHVVPKAVMAEALMGMIQNEGGAHPFDTVGGCRFTARIEGGMVVIQGGQGSMARVTQADVMQSNGVIHVIDAVLLPEQ